jgi:hypothetical protein
VQRRCSFCHLPSLVGRDQMPRVASQRIDYLIEVLKSYRDHPRPGADTAMSVQFPARATPILWRSLTTRRRCSAQSQNAKVRVSTLSRGGALGGVLGSSNAECAVNFVGTF